YWSNDLTGCLLIHEVILAADRGVRVRILLDDINAHGHDRAYLALSSHPNIDVRLFNPSKTRGGLVYRCLEMMRRGFRLNRRMHNKAWLADSNMAVIGGRNIGNAYFDAGEKSNFRDLDVKVLGRSVSQTQQIFNDFWNCRSSIPITRLGRRRRRD